MSTLEQRYAYAQDSALRVTPQDSLLELQTHGGVDQQRLPVAHPYFFMGAVLNPDRFAWALHTLASTVEKNYVAGKTNLSQLRDPVVTSGNPVLRFEGFSGCGGLYARVDVGPKAMDPVHVSHGTTNVDFNAPMRASLTQVSKQDALSLSVGSKEFALIQNEKVIEEKKVKLPERWVRGFAEASVIQSRMEPVFDMNRVQALRFLNALPSGEPDNASSWLTASGAGFRFSRQDTRRSVHVHGMQRLSLLKNLAKYAQALRVYTDPVSCGSSGWQISLGKDLSFSLALSPGIYRGFSGEGQGLETLLLTSDEDAFEDVEDHLNWQSVLTPTTLAALTGDAVSSVEQKLVVLGSQGQVGYDLGLQGFYHRELPFDLDKIPVLNPRLRSAETLVKKGAVQWLVPGKAALVHSGKGPYRVECKSPDDYRCTCKWFATHQGTRGYCKHILAVQLELLQDRV